MTTKKTETEMGSKQGESELDMKNLCNPTEEMINQRQERRTSERILHNMKKGVGGCNEKTINKRTLEGTDYTTSNSFSILDNDEIIIRSTAMGVNLDVSNFAHIDILKNMENARAALSNKMAQPVIDTVSLDPSLEDDNDIIAENEVESDFDDFVLVTPKRNRKPAKKFCFSGRKPPKSKHKENPCAASAQKTVSKETRCVTSTLTKENPCVTSTLTKENPCGQKATKKSKCKKK